MNINKYLLPVIVAMRHSFCDLVTDIFQELVPGADKRTRVQNLALLGLIQSFAVSIEGLEDFVPPAILVPYVDEINKAYNHLCLMQDIATNELEPYCQNPTEEEKISVENLIEATHPLMDRAVEYSNTFFNEDKHMTPSQTVAAFELFAKQLTSLVDEYRQLYANA